MFNRSPPAPSPEAPSPPKWFTLAGTTVRVDDVVAFAELHDDEDRDEDGYAVNQRTRVYFRGGGTVDVPVETVIWDSFWRREGHAA